MVEHKKYYNRVKEGGRGLYIRDSGEINSQSVCWVSTRHSVTHTQLTHRHTLASAGNETVCSWTLFGFVTTKVAVESWRWRADRYFRLRYFFLTRFRWHHAHHSLHHCIGSWRHALVTTSRAGDENWLAASQSVTHSRHHISQAFITPQMRLAHNVRHTRNCDGTIATLQAFCS